MSMQKFLYGLPDLVREFFEQMIRFEVYEDTMVYASNEEEMGLWSQGDSMNMGTFKTRESLEILKRQNLEELDEDETQELFWECLVPTSKEG